MDSARTVVSTGAARVPVEVVSRSETRDKGLSDRDSLPLGEGMLFVFDSDSEYCFWMKNMHFPLDMVWLNSRKEVVYIAHNARPEGFPKEVFCPDTAARYVIEVNAGQAEKLGFTLGRKVRF